MDKKQEKGPVTTTTSGYTDYYETLTNPKSVYPHFWPTQNNLPTLVTIQM